MMYINTIQPREYNEAYRNIFLIKGYGCSMLLMMMINIHVKYRTYHIIAVLTDSSRKFVFPTFNRFQHLRQL